jgi:hypothetical protein
MRNCQSVPLSTRRRGTARVADHVADGPAGTPNAELVRLGRRREAPLASVRIQPQWPSPLPGGARDQPTLSYYPAFHSSFRVATPQAGAGCVSQSPPTLALTSYITLPCFPLKLRCKFQVDCHGVVLLKFQGPGQMPHALLRRIAAARFTARSSCMLVMQCLSHIQVPFTVR